MITFSINLDVYSMNDDRIQKIIKLVQKAIEEKENLNWLSDAYLHIVDDKVKDFSTISQYTKEIEKNSMLKRAKNEVPIITQEEIARGYKGIKLDFFEKKSDFDDVEGQVLRNISKNCIIKEFYDFREKYYYQLGIDILRYLELLLAQDKVVIKRLRVLVEKNKDFGNILKLILENKEILEEIEKIF